MSEKTYVINVKTKLGTIFTVRADTAEELDANIASVIALDLAGSVAGLEEIITGIKPVAQDPIAILKDSLGATVINDTANDGFAPVAPPQTTAGSVGTRMCNHGPMIGRKGNGQKGEWKGLFCPTPKGTAGQCEPVWLNRSMPEWATV